MSTGEYITFIASDDQLTPDGIDIQLKAALASDASLILSDCELIDPGGELIAESAVSYFGKCYKRLAKKESLTKDVLLSWTPPYQHAFIRREDFFDLGCYDEKYSFEDRAFCLKAFAEKEVAFSPNVTWRYRIRLSDRLSPGLDRASLFKDLHFIYLENQSRYKGFNKFILKLLASSVEPGRVIKSLAAKVTIFGLRLIYR